MDDTARATHDVNTMIAGNIQLVAIMKKKKIDIHTSQSGFFVFGSEHSKLPLEVREEPIMIGSIVMKDKLLEKYPG